MITNRIEPYTLIRSRTLRNERKRQGWTQARLAKVLGVNTRTVIRWEQGYTLPQPSHRSRLETLFGKTIQELGLLWDTDEDNGADLMLPASPPVAQQAVLEVRVQEPPLIDPAIPLILGNNGSLLGRAELLMQIKERLLGIDRSPITALCGLPGIGKTTLMRALATDQQVRHHFCDGILWAPLGSQPYVLGQLTRWAMLLGITASHVANPESQLAWSRALRSAIGTRRMLLIIDDAWTVEDALALQVGGIQCTHLLTTCHPEVTRAFVQRGVILIPQLEEADGLVLLAQYVPHLVQQDPEGAQSLVQAVGGSPLALTLMGKCLTLLPTFTTHSSLLRATLTQLHTTQERLRSSMVTTSEEDWPTLAEKVSLPLYATIAMCEQQLSPQTRAALQALAIFPPNPHSFSEETALTISQQSIETLDELYNVGLLESWGPRRYNLHQTVVNYVRSRIEP